MQDHTGTLVNPRGFDMATTMAAITHDAGIANVKGGERIDNESFWDVDCDILIPAALEGPDHAERAQRIEGQARARGRQRPDAARGRRRARRARRPGRPDVICNAGGVTVSYFEWVQDFSSFFWSEDEINVRLDKIMVDALRKIWDTADRTRSACARRRSRWPASGS
jgi:glutamate dehydrogenase (NAD(P)+)